MKKFDSDNLIAEFSSLVHLIEGSKLLDVSVQVVADNFDIIYLKTDNGNFAVSGKVEDEVIRVEQCDSFPVVSKENNMQINRYAPFEIFTGDTISEIHKTESAWGGHGFEFRFTDTTSQSMIIQSVEINTKLNTTINRLRLGLEITAHHYNTY